MCRIEKPRKFSKKMLKFIQKGDKNDLHKDFLHCFEVLKTSPPTFKDIFLIYALFLLMASLMFSDAVRGPALQYLLVIMVSMDVKLMMTAS